jgi:alkylation response protein AidB-like acyl-CoA dehydrogenase
MDFALPERSRALVATVREFVESEVIPLEKILMTQGFRALEPALEAAREKVRALGLLAPHVAKEHGGGGLSLVEFAPVSEELGRSPLGHPVFNCQAPDAGNMELLAQFGTPEQQERWLRPLVAGHIRSCFAMTEPDRAGSNPTWLETTAVADGDDYVINGRKWFTTGAEGAAFTIVMAVTNPDASAPHIRASQIIVPAGTPGYRLVRNLPVMGEPGEGWASHAEVVFENCRVPQANRIGPEAGGFMLAQERLGPGRIHHCMRWIGICERAFELMCRRALTREMAPGELLGSRQLVQDWIATSRARIDAARLLVMKAAWVMDTQGQHAARDDVSVIKFFAADVLMDVLDRAIQAYGGAGLVDGELPLAFWYRHERAARIYDGADEVHRMSLAKRILARMAKGERR